MNSVPFDLIFYIKYKVFIAGHISSNKYIINSISRNLVNFGYSLIYFIPYACPKYLTQINLSYFLIAEI